MSDTERHSGLQLKLFDLTPTLESSVAQRTRRRTNVQSSYLKASYALGLKKNHTALDYGAGYQIGTKTLAGISKTVHSFEPYPDSSTGNPTFSTISQIPTDYYDRVFCLSVISVIPHDERVDLLKTIGSVLKPGGRALILARGSADLDLCLSEFSIDYGYCREYFTGYHRNRTRSVAFTQRSLESFVLDTLGKNFWLLPRPKESIYWKPWLIFEKGQQISPSSR